MRRHLLVITLLLISISFWIYLTLSTFEDLVENQKITVSEICQQSKNMLQTNKKYTYHTKLFQYSFFLQKLFLKKLSKYRFETQTNLLPVGPKLFWCPIEGILENLKILPLFLRSYVSFITFWCHTCGAVQTLFLNEFWRKSS